MHEHDQASQAAGAELSTGNPGVIRPGKLDLSLLACMEGDNDSLSGRSQRKRALMRNNNSLPDLNYVLVLLFQLRLQLHKIRMPDRTDWPAVRGHGNDM